MAGRGDDAVTLFRRVCCAPGCGRITEPGKSRCPLHPKRRVPGDRRYRKLAAAIIAASTHCGICGLPLLADPNDPPVVDHITPRAYGGTDDPANLQAAHRSCNGRKSSQLPGPYRGGGMAA
jgi:5-methylcytosine-specific restriction endonuclease McrA